MLFMLEVFADNKTLLVFPSKKVNHFLAKMFCTYCLFDLWPFVKLRCLFVVKNLHVFMASKKVEVRTCSLRQQCDICRAKRAHLPDSNELVAVP